VLTFVLSHVDLPLPATQICANSVLEPKCLATRRILASANLLAELLKILACHLHKVNFACNLMFKHLHKVSFACNLQFNDLNVIILLLSLFENISGSAYAL
jgi:hypothetical protein